MTNKYIQSEAQVREILEAGGVLANNDRHDYWFNQFPEEEIVEIGGNRRSKYQEIEDELFVVVTKEAASISSAFGPVSLGYFSDSDYYYCPGKFVVELFRSHQLEEGGVSMEGSFWVLKTEAKQDIPQVATEAMPGSMNAKISSNQPVFPHHDFFQKYSESLNDDKFTRAQMSVIRAYERREGKTMWDAARKHVETIIEIITNGGALDMVQEQTGSVFLVYPQQTKKLFDTLDRWSTRYCVHQGAIPDLLALLPEFTKDNIDPQCLTSKK